MSRVRSCTGLAVLGCATVLAGPAQSQPHHRLLQTSGSGWMVGNEVECTDPGGFAHWNTATVDWYLNTAGQGAGKEAAIQAALATWNDAGTEYDLRYAGTWTGGYMARDFRNTISWGTDGVCDTNFCHAITALFVQAPTTTPNGQVILESDILFNANPNRNFQWRTDGQHSPSCWQTANSSGLVIDTQGIATHELGHSLGIGHPTNQQDSSQNGPTMGVLACTTEGRTLNADDIAALACSENRYPRNPWYTGSFTAGTCRSVSGTASNTNRPGQPTYVEVIEMLADGTTRVVYVVPTQPSSSQFSSVPLELFDGRWHSLRVRHTGTGQELPGGPRDIICGVPLFPPTPEPADHLSTGGVPYEVATQFSSTHGGYITELGYYFSPGESGARTARLWSDTGTLLASVSLSPPNSLFGIGWSYAPLGTKVQIQPNVRYRVAITTFQQQSKTPCGLSSPLTNGPLTAHQGFWSAGNGTASPFMPSTSSCSNFWVSVRFET